MDAAVVKSNRPQIFNCSPLLEWNACRMKSRIERMSYQLKKLHAKHWKMLDLYFEGRTGKEIAEAVGRTPRAVSYIINSDVSQEAVSYRRAGMEAAANQAHARAVYAFVAPQAES